jgi:vesicle coat complex subunit
LQEKQLENSEISREQLIAYLISMYTEITVPLAKSSILWLLGHHTNFKHACDGLRIALQTFGAELPTVKKQILTLATLLLLQKHNSTDNDGLFSKFALLAFEYSMKLAKYDIDYDVRDHGRLLEKLCTETLNDSNRVTRLVQILTQNNVKKEDIVYTKSEYLVGTLSHLLNRQLKGYLPYPEWSSVDRFQEERVVSVVL